MATAMAMAMARLLVAENLISSGESFFGVVANSGVCDCFSAWKGLKSCIYGIGRGSIQSAATVKLQG